MAGMHLSEIELLECAEHELPERELAEATAHLDTCAACRARLQELEAARALLRASPLLELPPTVLARVVGSLPPQEREGRAWRRFASPRRLALVALPVAAVAIVAVTVSLTVGNGDGAGPRTAAAEEPMLESAEAQAEAAAPSAGDAATAEAGGGDAESAPPTTETAMAQPVLVAGPVEEVAQILEDAGFAVRVEGTTVTVVGATPEEVAALLAARAPGTVEVVVVP